MVLTSQLYTNFQGSLYIFLKRHYYAYLKIYYKDIEGGREAIIKY